MRIPPSVGRLLRPPSPRNSPRLPSAREPFSRKSARLRIWLGTLPVRERIELPERELSKPPLLEPSLLTPERVPEKLLRLLDDTELRLLLELRLTLLLGLELRLLEKLLRLLELELRLLLEKLEPLRLLLEKPPPPRLTLELLL